MTLNSEAVVLSIGNGRCSRPNGNLIENVELLKGKLRKCMFYFQAALNLVNCVSQFYQTEIDNGGDGTY